jgi:uncharacterized cofD-like protein
VVIVFVANTLLAVGAAMFLLDIYRTTPDVWWLPLLSYASLRFLARPVRVLIFGGLGFGLLGWGIWNLNRSLMEPFVPKDRPVVEQLARFRQLERGPRLVAVGGGTGQATLLRGLKEFTHNLFAIVSVADDGGSSGRLRRSLGILPPGDIRNCLAALSKEEDLVSQLFQYRFAQDGDLVGHSFGNLYLTALTEITGSFEEAIITSGKVLGVQGRVLPATLANVTLEADVALPNKLAEVRVSGESRIPTTNGNIQRVWLNPGAPPAYPKSLQAILTADMVVIGPGSLYTSVLPNMLVPEIADALRSTRAIRVYVINVATQPGETHGYTAGDHLRALEDHLGDLPFEIILCNDRYDLVLPEGTERVTAEQNLETVYPVHFADVVDENNPWRHDSAKLARVLIDLLEERTGPLVV